MLKVHLKICKFFTANVSMDSVGPSANIRADKGWAVKRALRSFLMRDAE